jgi:hypothetical protein
MTTEINLLSYLIQSRVFKFVYENSPEFVIKHAYFFERAPWSVCAYRDYMKYAHCHLLERVLRGDIAYTVFDGLSFDVLSSPIALDYCLKNPRVMDLVKVGGLNYLDVMVMAGRRGDGHDGPPKEGEFNRIQNIINTPDVYKGRE